ncbi:hypothetical protein RHSIM_Rhsim07G0156100 [Rhododendron simsii]|uniref:indole-3-pyruvate monooxygenase n=1 Tax=Rhododendron simsii TaxID=118357 RepID=A0A834GPU7_RHOSS|nr:hypothetical protein RHSIM_Rhsim07G0156100 [Rhododendron simsii]
MFGFPTHFPKYPTKTQFISYLESYAEHFSIEPRFRQAEEKAEFDSRIGFWRVRTQDCEYFSQWLIVATGENAEPFEPDIQGIEKFEGIKVHTSGYISGCEFRNQRVLVVGCGNSGNTDKLGLWRPKTGPIELKNATGKTPVLDVGALSQIKSGKIKVVEGVREITRKGAKFRDGQEKEYDSIILATGYRSNVPCWLKCSDFFAEDGMPKTPFPNSWKGEKGLYTVSFTKRGLLGTASDSINIARDIADFSNFIQPPTLMWRWAHVSQCWARAIFTVGGGQRWNWRVRLVVVDASACRPRLCSAASFVDLLDTIVFLFGIFLIS